MAWVQLESASVALTDLERRSFGNEVASTFAQFEIQF